MDLSKHIHKTTQHFINLSSTLKIVLIVAFVLIVGSGGFVIYTLNAQIKSSKTENKNLNTQLKTVQKELIKLKNEDQFVRNENLQKDIKNIETTYKSSLSAYEKLLELKRISKNTDKLDASFANILDLLSKRNYSSASALLVTLNNDIATEQQKIASTFVIPQNVTKSNAPPASGFAVQSVSTDIGDFLVSIISGDLGSTRVTVDTASDSTCKDGCPVLSLGDYASRSGAYAGINGSYFCPADYPSCAGKSNSFDTLLMNKNKVYFNSDNNVYSTVPAAIFGNGFMRFVGQSLDWGRDTGVDGVIANQPLLVSGGNVVFGGDGDPKKGGKGNRSFVANKGSVAYIGVVQNATVAEAAHALKALGMDNALNLDSGGSTALWYSGSYKFGPGRNLPNAILFIRK